MMTKNIIIVAAMFMFALTVGILTAESSNDRASAPTISPRPNSLASLESLG
jgi:hypothetical protein